MYFNHLKDSRSQGNVGCRQAKVMRWEEEVG